MAGLMKFLPGEGKAYNLLRSLAAGTQEISSAVSTALTAFPNLREEMAQNFLEFYRSPQGASRNYINSLSNTKLPNLQNIPKSVTPRAKNFFYQLEMRGKDLETGENVTKYFTVSSNRLLTKGEAKASAESMAVAEQDRYGLDVSDSVVTGIYQNVSGIDTSVL